MKKRVFRNYYTRLIGACYTAVFCMVLFAVCLIVYVLNSKRIDESIQKYDAALRRLVSSYEELWDNHYQTFAPIFDKRNSQSFITFCEGKLSGYQETVARENVARIFSEICLQDERIKGVYFWRCADNTRYLYFEDDRTLRETQMVLDGYINVKSLPALVGGRRIFYGVNGEKSADVFGLQSRVLSACAEDRTGEYQITMLYDAHCFDWVIAEYGLDAAERYLILAQTGMVLYDSKGGYADNAVVYEGAENLLRGEASFELDNKAYVANAKSINSGKSTISYIVPQRMVSGIRLDGSITIVLLIALGIDVLLLAVLLAIKRLFDRKFTELEVSMSQIGRHNLDYRMPVKGQDEFSRISAHFNLMCDDLQAMINKYYVYQMLQQKAEFQALKTRVNPHFLYNSLETIREMLIKGGRQEEADVVVLLSRIFDYQIHSDSVVSLWMEKDVLLNYIEFLAIRCMYAFEYLIDIDENILNYKMPKQILQPVVENCFERVLRKEESGQLEICGRFDEAADRIRISFRYSGQYANRELADQIRAALKNTMEEELLNLENVYRRLRIFFGEDCGIQILEDAVKSEVRVELTFKRVLSITENTQP